MLQLLIEYGIVCILMIPLGFIVLKWTYWGLAILLPICGTHLMLESKDVGETWSVGIDAILNMWTLYPRVIQSMISQGSQSGDALTLIVYTVIGILPLFPFAVGVGLAVVYYPDLWLFGYILGLIFR